MLFILIAWLLVLLTFAIWLRALHSIQIYTHTPLQLHEQTLQVQNVMSFTQILLALAIACVGLHVMLPDELADRHELHVHSNASTYASAMALARNLTS
jgi:hypothetical protein